MFVICNKFWCSAVSNRHDCSKRITHYSLADLSNQTLPQVALCRSTARLK